jgi:hypothetical protein
MSKPINELQNSAEAWELGAGLINSVGGTAVVYKDENGIYHTINSQINTEILGGTTDVIVLSGEIVEPQP